LCKLGNDFFACVGNSTTTGMIYKQTNGEGAFMSLAYTAQKYTGIVAYGNDLYISVYGADIYKLVNGSGTLTAVNGSANNWRNIIAINDRMYAASNSNALIYKYDIATSKFLPHGIRISGALIKLGAYSNGLLVGAESSGDLYYQKEVKALNVFCLNEEVETNTTWLGYKLYTKVIEIGPLPQTAGVKSVAHGIDTSNGIHYKSQSLVCKNPTNGYNFSPNTPSMSNYHNSTYFNVNNTDVVVYSTSMQVYTIYFT
jgi:hypothetical protein